MEEGPRQVRFIETERGVAVASRWGNGGSPLMGAEFQSCKMKRVLEMDCTAM